jgi:hypothetical protein
LPGQRTIAADDLADPCNDREPEQNCHANGERESCGNDSLHSVESDMELPFLVRSGSAQ